MTHGGFATCTAVFVVALSACKPVDPELLPDAELRTELGLTDEDRVHTVSLSTGVGELADPGSLAIEPGELVQFVSTDWFVHEVRFDLDAMTSSAREFLERTSQTASPPLLQEGSRLVLTFEGLSGVPPVCISGTGQCTSIASVYCGILEFAVIVDDIPRNTGSFLFHRLKMLPNVAVLPAALQAQASQCRDAVLQAP